MTKEMAKAMLVAQRYTETRMTANAAKDAAKDLLHNGLQLNPEDRELVYAFMDMCERVMDVHRTYAAEEYVGSPKFREDL